MGMRRLIRSYRSGWVSGMAWVSSVMNQPGRIALDWMLSPAQATAKALGQLHDAALAGRVGHAAAAAAEDAVHAADADNLTAALTP